MKRRDWLDSYRWVVQEWVVDDESKVAEHGE